VLHIFNKNKFEKAAVNFDSNGCKISQPDDIVEKFNDYFVNIGKNLSSKIPPNSVHFSSYRKNPLLHSFKFTSCDSSEIVEIVKDLNDKNSFGYDLITISIIKRCIFQISEPLSALVNISFQTGLFPD